MRLPGFSLLLLISIGAGFISSAYCAELPSPLRLDQAVAIGLQRNLGLQATAEIMTQAAAGVAVANADFDPTLRFGGDAGEKRTPVASPFVGTSALLEHTSQGELGVEKRFHSGLSADLALSSRRLTTNDNFAGLNPEYRTSLVLTITQPLLRDFGRKINRSFIRQQQLVSEQALLDYRRQGQLLAANIEAAYIDLAQAQAVMLHRQGSLDLALELLQGNRRKLALGLIPKSEVQQAETSAEARREQLLFARQQFENSRELLLDLLEGTPGPELAILALPRPVLPQFSLDQAISSALKQRPDLQLVVIDRERTEVDIRYRRNKLLPQLNLQAAAGFNGLSGREQSSLNSSYAGTWPDSFGSALDRDGYQWQAGLALRYPLGNQAARAELSIAESRRRQSLKGHDRLVRQITTEVRRAWIVLQRSLERIDVAQRNVRLAEKTLEQENARVKAGLSDSFRLLIIQDALIEAQIRLVQARGDAERGQAVLNLTMGTNLQQRGIRLRLPSKES